MAEEVARLRFQAVDTIAVLVRASVPGVAQEAATAYAHLVSGAGEQLAKWWRSCPDVPFERVVGYHLDVLWRGLAAVAEEAR